MLQALGFHFFDENGVDVPLGGQGLAVIEGMDIEAAHSLLKECTFQVACDVKNVLYGENGAAYVFGPQKGATSEMVQELDSGLRNFAQVVSRDLGIDVQNIEGAGAAGGLGAAFSGLLNGEMQSGIDLILSIMDIETKLKGVDIVVTGEGMLDGQTSMGKAPSGVAQIASKKGIPVLALAGGINRESFSLNGSGITACFSIVTKPMSLEEAMYKDIAYENLKFTTSQLFRLIKGVSKN
jgi:glycerate 2-kinase